MNQLPLDRRCQVISVLVEGCSIRSTVRMTGVAKNTIVKLLVDVGTACSEYQNQIMRGLACNRLQIDEIWSFCHSKAKNVQGNRILIRLVTEEYVEEVSLVPASD